MGGKLRDSYSIESVKPKARPHLFRLSAAAGVWSLLKSAFFFSFFNIITKLAVSLRCVSWPGVMLFFQKSKIAYKNNFFFFLITWWVHAAMAALHVRHLCIPWNLQYCSFVLHICDLLSRRGCFPASSLPVRADLRVGYVRCGTAFKQYWHAYQNLPH